ncbi:MAG: hypothetical protein SO072_07580 [Dysosmobacter sp.]|nr:hypothetical protein [Dysosmobacter sp.]
MQVISRYLSGLGHLVVTIAAGDQVVILQPKVKTLLQRRNVMYLQWLII